MYVPHTLFGRKKYIPNSQLKGQGAHHTPTYTYIPLGMGTVGKGSGTGVEGREMVRECGKVSFVNTYIITVYRGEGQGLASDGIFFEIFFFCIVFFFFTESLIAFSLSRIAQVPLSLPRPVPALLAIYIYYLPPWGSGTVKNPKNIWKKYWVIFCTRCPSDKKSCVPKLDFLPGQMHQRMSVSAQGFAKDNLHWVNSSDLTNH